MNKTISLRAWLVEQQRWAPLSSEHMAHAMEDGPGTYGIFQVESDPTALVWQRGIELKATQGYELFEGDLVRYKNDPTDLREVIYVGATPLIQSVHKRRYYHVKVNGVVNKKKFRYTRGKWHLTVYKDGDLSYVGNIFENKELMK